MTTGRDLCTDALKEAGILGVGQTALPEDINDAFTRLQRMLATWQKQRWLIPSLEKINFTGDANKTYYTIGLGGDINMKPPSDIKGGYVVQRNTGTTPVSLQLQKIFSFEDYIRISVKELRSLPTYFFYDNRYPLGRLYPWPIANSTYELNFLLQSRLIFDSTISVGNIEVGGTLYTDGIYEDVELTGGFGTGAQADITVTNGAVAIVTLKSGGQGYVIGDILGVDPDSIGGTGSGFEYKVDDVTSNLDSEIIMPEEYEEAIMYNLAIRVCSMYQVQALGSTVALAKSGLNNIRKNNTQVPALQMPVAPGVRTGKSFNIYNPDGY